MTNNELGSIKDLLTNVDDILDQTADLMYSYDNRFTEDTPPEDVRTFILKTKESMRLLELILNYLTTNYASSFKNN